MLDEVAYRDEISNNRPRVVYNSSYNTGQSVTS